MKRLSLALVVVPVLLMADPENPTIATLRAKAEQGVAGAQFNLAGLYARGYGVPKDLVVAVDWYRKSAEQGFGEAQFSLAMAYLNGDGVPRNEIEGLAWIEVGARTGGASLVRFRDKLEQQLGPETTAAARKRSEELHAVIEARKRAKADAR